MEKRRVVITGVSGFVGYHLASELKSNDVSVIGVGYEEEAPAHLDDVIDEYISADLTQNWPGIESVDSIIHLAGFAAVGPSFDNPQKYINGNSSMVTHMCEYYLGQDKKPRVVIISSGAIYDADQSMPISETGRVGFNSPYAVSKILTENQAEYYRGRGLECVVLRPFNHIGPGQAEGFILPDLYKQLSENSEGKIMVGNLETRRDYTDVRDIVRAYGKMALAPNLKHGLYNVCSGRSLSGMEILNALKTCLNKENVVTEVDQSKIRPNDIMEIIGDSSRLQEELDWHPNISIGQTIQDFVDSKS
jgi:GDP-4-dehydro-6-deoxy-D-mannose reductase